MDSIGAPAVPSTEAPPVYTSQPSNNQTKPPAEASQPPSYAFPTAFIIGGQRTVPLVTAAQLKGHLALLNAFANLRETVEGLDDKEKQPIELFPTEKDMRWSWFVAFAVDRFSVWCESLTVADASHSSRTFDIIPPVDVLMVWHSYMLNPGWYSEDCTRVPKLRILLEVGEQVASALPQALHALITEPPTPDRRALWETKTHRAFDPLQDAAHTGFKSIRCPACGKFCGHSYMNVEGTGYLQQKFTLKCPSSACQQAINHSTLGARKLAEDLVSPYSTSSTRRSYLAGTLRTPDTLANNLRGQTVKDAVLKSASISPSPSLPDEQWIKHILVNHSYSPGLLKATMAARLRAGGGRLIARIMSAYTNGAMFSVELVGAVIRQGSFVEKMRALKWTEPGYFDDPLDEIALQHSIARYHGFLDLMSSSPAAFFVPTLDIDLAWHTHQLLGSKYNTDCKNLVGRFIDHDDKVEEDTLASAFDVTCRAWKNRFNVQYMHCGCPAPGETIGQRLSKFVASGSNGPKSYLVPPSSSADDLSVLAATHPSDHNSVFNNHKKSLSTFNRNRRREKRKKRLTRDQELVRKGKLDQRALDRGYAHDPAFLLPLPLWYYYPIGVGCAAYAGGVVDGSAGCGNAGSCAAGAGACGTGGSACGGGAGCGGSGGGCGGGGGGCGGGGGAVVVVAAEPLEL